MSEPKYTPPFRAEWDKYNCHDRIRDANGKNVDLFEVAEMLNTRSSLLGMVPPDTTLDSIDAVYDGAEVVGYRAKLVRRFVDTLRGEGPTPEQAVKAAVGRIGGGE